jgi:hypothetical protein
MQNKYPLSSAGRFVAQIKYYIKRYFKHGLTHIALMAYILLTTEIVKAQTSVPDHAVSKASVNYLGMKQSMLLFNIKYDNPAGYHFSVIVWDDGGNRLYEESYNGKHFYKTFALHPDDIDKVTFIIKGPKRFYLKRSFRIHTHFSEDAEVTLL